MSGEFEIRGRGEPIVRFGDRAEVDRFFAAFEIEIPQVVFDTLLPGVPFVVNLPRRDFPAALTLVRSRSEAAV